MYCRWWSTTASVTRTAVTGPPTSPWLLLSSSPLSFSDIFTLGPCRSYQQTLEKEFECNSLSENVSRATRVVIFENIYNFTILCGRNIPVTINYQLPSFRCVPCTYILCVPVTSYGSNSLWEACNLWLVCTVAPLLWCLCLHKTEIATKYFHVLTNSPSNVFPCPGW